MTGQLLTSAGLLLDIIGVVMLFRYGLPPAGVSRRTGSVLEWGGNQAEVEARKKKVERYDRRSYVALVLIVSGFFLQGLAVWVC